ncbi:MAG: hypothetical protein Q9187_001893 [Circinaria calcarea]
MDASQQQESVHGDLKIFRRKLVQEWEVKGFMTPERIMRRLGMKMDEYGLHSAAEPIQKNFNLPSVESLGARYLDEASFTSFLARAFPPSFSPIIEAAPIIYASAVYLAGFPFYEQSPPLTFEAFRRAITLMLPDYAHTWIAASGDEECLITRERTEIDHLRLLFQSMATSDNESVQDLQSNDQGFKITMTPRPSKYDFDWRAPNIDADGDEMYHDVLDVLSATQPKQIYETSVSRDDQRSLATSLWQTRLCLSQYRMSREKLKPLVRLMLCMQLSDMHQQGSYSTDRLHELEASTNCVVNAFEVSNDKGITWPIFYSTTTMASPLLLRPLYNLLDLFLKSQDAILEYDDQVLPAEGRIFTLPLLCQLNIVLADTITLDGLKLLYQCQPLSSTFDTKFFNQLKDILKAYSEPCILLVRGQTTLNESITFGAFLPVAGLDTSHIAKSPDYRTSFLFQLSPVHDIFPAPAGEPVWASSDQGLWFGDEAAGVAFHLMKDLQKGMLLHRITDQGSYRGNSRRGEWQAEVIIHELEIWKERE